MPRGSRPGERRGGRQRGAPNKKTLIKNAVFLAAAAVALGLSSARRMVVMVSAEWRAGSSALERISARAERISAPVPW